MQLPRFLRPRPPAPPPLAVVYTMGKVGSSSVSAGLRAAGLACHHIHSLRHDTLLRQTRTALAQNRFPPRHTCLSMAWREQILDRERCRYISLVRDPMARTLSAFFENLFRRTDGLTAASPPEALFEAYCAEAHHEHWLDWFGFEFRDQLGIDVFARPFDRAARMVELPESHTVIFRIDCPETRIAEVLSRTFGRPVAPIPTNIGSQKDYAAAYAAVRQMARFPRDLTDRIYDSAFVRHFWTEAEREEMRARWTAPAGAAAATDATARMT